MVDRLVLGEEVPDFIGESTVGSYHFHERTAGHWTLLTSHPAAFTAVCSTELVSESRGYPELVRRGTLAVTISEGTVDQHRRWAGDLAAVSGISIPIPIIADPARELGRHLRLLTRRRDGRETLARIALIVDPTHRIRWAAEYPLNVGRSLTELLRVIDALQLADKEHLVRIPADWVPGDRTLLSAAVDTLEARHSFGDVRELLPYWRTVAPARRG